MNASKLSLDSYDSVKEKEALKNRKFEIDYVGTGSFQKSQLNLLHKRSVELFKNSDAILSARGLHHRSKDVFTKEVKSASVQIAALMRREKVTSAKYIPSSTLFMPTFQRAIGHERLGEIDKAIKDYSFCLRIDPKSSAVSFNRAGLFKIKGNYKAAIEDMNRAINIDPANIEYRNYRALLFRESNQYVEAVKDTLIERALYKQPDIAKSLMAGGDVKLDGDLLYATKMIEDPIISSIAVPPGTRQRRQLESIAGFIRSLKFFAPFSNNKDVINKISQKLELATFAKGSFIFHEGDFGDQFFIIYDGEVSIVKMKKTIDDNEELKVLVKMYRGQSFGETALESQGGLRTAGALSSQLTRLFTLRAEDYQTILSQYKSVLSEEVRHVLGSSLLFNSWEPSKLDYLSSFAVVRGFGANTEILKANEKCNNLYLIKSGIVKIMKSMPKPDISNITLAGWDSTGYNSSKGELEEIPGLWVVDKNWKQSEIDDKEHENDPNYVEFTVGILGSGQVFGELSVLDPDKLSPVSAISSTAVELYSFESDILLSLGIRFNVNTMNSLTESVNLHDPPAEKISFYFRTKYNWELRKNRLIKRLVKKK